MFQNQNTSKSDIILRKVREITRSWNEVSSDATKKRKGAGIQALDLGQDPHLTSF